MAAAKGRKYHQRRDTKINGEKSFIHTEDGTQQQPNTEDIWSNVNKRNLKILLNLGFDLLSLGTETEQEAGLFPPKLREGSKKAWDLNQKRIRQRKLAMRKLIF